MKTARFVGHHEAREALVLAVAGVTAIMLIANLLLMILYWSRLLVLRRTKAAGSDVPSLKKSRPAWREAAGCHISFLQLPRFEQTHCTNAKDYRSGEIPCKLCCVIRPWPVRVANDQWCRRDHCQFQRTRSSAMWPILARSARRPPRAQ